MSKSLLLWRSTNLCCAIMLVFIAFYNCIWSLSQQYLISASELYAKNYTLWLSILWP